MQDYHCHLLPGLDDGAGDLEDSLRMARLLAGAGFTEVFCTPHCLRGLYEYTPTQVCEATAHLQRAIDQQGIALKLWAGMEYCLDEFFGHYLAELKTLGETRMVLVEAPPRAEFAQIADGIFQLTSRGYIPLLAHPERTSCLAPAPEESALARFLNRLRPSKGEPPLPDPAVRLKKMGCLFQGNLGSLAGYYGVKVQALARYFLHAGFYDHFGSDAHASLALKSYLTAGLQVARGNLDMQG